MKSLSCVGSVGISGRLSFAWLSFSFSISSSESLLLSKIFSRDRFFKHSGKLKSSMLPIGWELISCSVTAVPPFKKVSRWLKAEAKAEPIWVFSFKFNISFLLIFKILGTLRFCPRYKTIYTKKARLLVFYKEKVSDLVVYYFDFIYFSVSNFNNLIEIFYNFQFGNIVFSRIGGVIKMSKMVRMSIKSFFLNPKYF